MQVMGSKMKHNNVYVDNFEIFRKKMIELRNLARLHDQFNKNDFLPVFHQRYKFLHDLLGEQIFQEWLFDDEPAIFKSIVEDIDVFEHDLVPTEESINLISNIFILNNDVTDIQIIEELLNIIKELKYLLAKTNDLLASTLFLKSYEKTQKLIGTHNLYSFFTENEFLEIYHIRMGFSTKLFFK